MHNQIPYIPNVTIPYSRWSQHRAENGLIYLSNPQTGEVKWLWSRHRDPATSHDYLVNTITGKRQWVTPENERLCPVDSATDKPSAPLPRDANSPKPTRTSAPSTASSSSLGSSSTQSKKSNAHAPRTTNPFSEMPKAPQKAATNLNRHATRPASHPYKEISAPKSLGLTADEALMIVPETGRRYVFNKKTKTSRWLPDQDHSSASTSPGKGIFRRKSSKPGSSPFDDDGLPASEIMDRLPSKQTAASSKLPSEDKIAATLYNTSISSPSRPKSFPQTSPHRKQPSQPKQAEIPSQNFSGATGVNPHSVPNSSRTYMNAAYPIRPSSLPTTGAPTYSRNEAASDIQRYLRAYLMRKADVAGKIGMLNALLHEIRQLTESGKYDIKYLRKLIGPSFSKEERADGSQRLLELGEFLTQKMLKVDLVESAGNQMVRAKRKESVKMILSLTDEIDELRKRLNVMQK